VTSYTYTLLGKLNVVTMTRPGKGVGAPPTVTQTRTYAYNSNGELQSVTHPENGATLYEYFDDGSLKKKTDAKGQRLEWSYDAEGRPLMVKRFSSLGVEDVCARVTTTYGSQGLDGSFSGANLAGRLASVTTGCQYVPAGETETKGGRVDELYSYTSAGAVVTKRVRILRGNSTVTKDIGYTFDGEGKLATMQYPDEAKPFVMSYDAMARPSGMTQEYQLGGTPDWLNRNWVSGVSYGVAGQLVGMSWYGGGSSTFGETRTYNERLQLTRQQATGMDLEYVFTDGQNPMNDGRIIARINRSGTGTAETVKYKYDELNRLIEAEQTTGPGAETTWWGMTWDFDGFGNRWSQSQKDQRVGIPSSVTFDLGTNRVNSAGYGHDANGNMTAMPGVNGALIYDIDNRLTKVDRNGSHEQYRYLGDNKRYWKRTNQGGNVAEEYYLYGVGGQRIATYAASYNEQTSVLTVGAKKLDVYFGGKVIWQNGKAVVQDRLGSVMARGNGSGGVESHDYYPYGEERVATVGDRNKFGTYHRDQTGLDYADQRYFSSITARFLSPDPIGSGLNHYSYTAGDPVNENDPSGLLNIIIGGMAGIQGALGLQVGSTASWAQPGTDFYEAVTQYFGGPTMVFHWSGSGDPGAIETAGEQLHAFILAHLQPGEPLNIVAHSHASRCCSSHRHLSHNGNALGGAGTGLWVGGVVLQCIFKQRFRPAVWRLESHSWSSGWRIHWRGLAQSMGWVVRLRGIRVRSFPYCVKDDEMCNQHRYQQRPGSWPRGARRSSLGAGVERDDQLASAGWLWPQSSERNAQLSL